MSIQEVCRSTCPPLFNRPSQIASVVLGIALCILAAIIPGLPPYGGIVLSISGIGIVLGGILCRICYKKETTAETSQPSQALTQEASQPNTIQAQEHDHSQKLLAALTKKIACKVRDPVHPIFHSLICIRIDGEKVITKIIKSPLENDTLSQLLKEAVSSHAGKFSQIAYVTVQLESKYCMEHFDWVCCFWGGDEPFIREFHFEGQYNQQTIQESISKYLNINYVKIMQEGLSDPFPPVTW